MPFEKLPLASVSLMEKWIYAGCPFLSHFFLTDICYLGGVMFS
jgi:hypothetical protein